MRKIFIFLSLALIFARCVDPLEVRYYGTISVEGDLESAFLVGGESRTVRVSVQKEKYMNDYATGQIFPVAAADIRVEIEHGPFEITNQRIVSEYELEFDITVPENEYSDTKYYELHIIAEEDREEPIWFWFWVMQDDRNKMMEYRIVSQENPLRIPVEGGNFTCDIEIQSRKVVDGVPREWRSTEFGAMKYRYECSAASHHVLRLAHRGVGKYTFFISAAPYYTESGDDVNWKFALGLHVDDIDISFEQLFLHPQDPALRDTGAGPATGKEFHYGYLTDYQNRPL